MRSPTAIIAGCAAILVAASLAYWYTDAESLVRDERREVLRQGIALFEQKKYPEALQELQAIPIDRTDDWRVPYYLGSTHMMLKDYAAAAGALERALDDEEARLRMGREARKTAEAFEYGRVIGEYAQGLGRLVGEELVRS